MNRNRTVIKPEKRGKLRKFLGTEFFILKRRMKWAFDKNDYAEIDPISKDFNHIHICHRSFLLRPLKDVDMLLQHNKVTNLRLAVETINGVVIKSGETFSLWKLVGRPTRRKGFLDGLVLHNGEISKGVGGGLCQLGNLIYWMALHTDLDVVERWRHGYDVFPDVNRVIPFACGATLSYNYVDLQLKNNTTDAYSIKLWLDDEYLNGSIKCEQKNKFKFEVFETDHLITQQWWGGYTRHNRIWKRKIDLLNNKEEEHLIAENHAIMMYNPLLSQ